MTDAALSIVRGPPLADLSLLEFVQPEIRRLEELRLLALMERIDADLDMRLNIFSRYYFVTFLCFDALRYHWRITYQ